MRVSRRGCWRSKNRFTISGASSVSPQKLVDDRVVHPLSLGEVGAAGKPPGVDQVLQEKVRAIRVHQGHVVGASRRLNDPLHAPPPQRQRHEGGVAGAFSLHKVDPESIRAALGKV